LKGETWSVAISPGGAIEKRLLEEDPYADRLEMEPESPGNLPGFQIGPNRLTIDRILPGFLGKDDHLAVIPLPDPP
jgi:hypothetical protein